jgi:NAD(P)-dependent dehydrogenase (short-subunit alcohol dehydrogenase family)
VVDHAQRGLGAGGDVVDLDGKTAVVTGAAAGTGRAIAQRLGREGVAVVIADIDLEQGKQTVRYLQAEGGRATFVRADVRIGDDLHNLMEVAERTYQGLDILVNNAGGGGHVEPHYPAASPLQWGATLDLNLRGAMLATQLALALMRRRGAGAVVNIASTEGLGFGPHQSPEYAAAKAALIRFTSSLAGLREAMGVRVNCVVPDWIATERAVAELAGMSQAVRAATLAPIPPEEVADAVVECIRDDRLAGRVMVLWRGAPRRLLDPGQRQ